MSVGTQRRPPSLVGWLIPAAAIVAAALLVLTAPAERTLGDGIRVVYVHVALTWAGAVGLVAAGLVGGALAFTGREWLRPWMAAVGWVGWGFYLAGFLVSMGAAQVNWGGVNALFWREPRTVGAIQVLAVALIVLVLGGWLRWPRVQGALNAVLAAFVAWSSLGTTTFILHPSAAVGASSEGVQARFAAVFLLSCLGGAWSVWRLRRAWGAQG